MKRILIPIKQQRRLRWIVKTLRRETENGGQGDINSIEALVDLVGKFCNQPIDERTIHRDLTILRKEFGAPIKTCYRGRGGGRDAYYELTDPDWSLGLHGEPERYRAALGSAIELCSKLELGALARDLTALSEDVDALAFRLDAKDMGEEVPESALPDHLARLRPGTLRKAGPRMWASIQHLTGGA